MSLGIYVYEASPILAIVKQNQILIEWSIVLIAIFRTYDSTIFIDQP